MFYRKKSYQMDPKDVERFTRFFHQYIYPNQIKNGAELVGRWVSEDRHKITAIWKYKSRAAYERTERLVKRDPMHKEAMEARKRAKPLKYESQETFMQLTGNYEMPKHIVAASAAVFNEKGEILLVKTYWRDDTWELPGGQVELGESLENAVIREVEETGIACSINGVTGVYKNIKRDILNMTFKGRVVSGNLQSSEETSEVGFFSPTEENLRRLITRPHFLERALDARHSSGTASHSSYMSKKG